MKSFQQIAQDSLLKQIYQRRELIWVRNAFELHCWIDSNRMTQNHLIINHPNSFFGFKIQRAAPQKSIWLHCNAQKSESQAIFSRNELETSRRKPKPGNKLRRNHTGFSSIAILIGESSRNWESRRGFWLMRRRNSICSVLYYINRLQSPIISRNLERFHKLP